MEIRAEGGRGVSGLKIQVGDGSSWPGNPGGRGVTKSCHLSLRELFSKNYDHFTLVA